MEAYYINYLIPSIIAVLLILSGTYYFHSRDRNEKIKRIIAPLGLKQINNKQFYKYIDKNRFSLLSSKIAPIYISKAYCGKYNEYDVCLFQVGSSGMGSGGRHYTAVHIKVTSTLLPKFVIKPKDLDDKVVGFFGFNKNEISFNPEFSKQYYVSGDTESHVRAVFNQDTIHFFKNYEGLTFESSGNEFIYFKTFDSAKHGQFLQYIKRAISLLSLFKNGNVESDLIKTLDNGNELLEKAKKQMNAAILSLIFTAIIIALTLYDWKIGQAQSPYIVILILYNLFFTIHAWRKKRNAELRSHQSSNFNH